MTYMSLTINSTGPNDCHQSVRLHNDSLLYLGDYLHWLQQWTEGTDHIEGFQHISEDSHTLLEPEGCLQADCDQFRVKQSAWIAMWFYCHLEQLYIHTLWYSRYICVFSPKNFAFPQELEYIPLLEVKMGPCTSLTVLHVHVVSGGGKKGEGEKKGRGTGRIEGRGMKVGRVG